MVLAFHNVRPASVHLRDVSVSTGPGESGRAILSHVDADFPAGTVTGIMGSSGSGKTTLLNALSCRTSPGLVVSGTLSYNSSSDVNSVSNAYVTQADVLLPTLTVRETLRYAADLRLPGTASCGDRRKLVEEIIDELGLQDCADTIVGGGLRRRGCSGGERRRVSIGVQMLANPSLLFLDEPTTGLDATSAFQLVRTLKSLASKGRTIIVTIHQPRSDIFFLLDRIVLLVQGQPVYSGVTADALPWFDAVLPGHLIPHVNPADYLIDMAALDTRTNKAETITRARVDKLLSAWRNKSKLAFEPVSPPSATPSQHSTQTPKAPQLRVISTLIKRSTLTNLRDPLGLSAAWIEAVLMSLAIGLIFLDLPDSLSGVRSRQAALYICTGLQGYLMSSYEVYRLCVIEMPTFDRERSEGVVSTSSFLIAYRLSHLILEDIFVPLIFSTISYFLMGLPKDRFGVFLAVMTLSHFAAMTSAGLAVAFTRDFAAASWINNMSCTVQVFTGGFYIQADSIPVYVRWLKWIGHGFYIFTSLVENTFKDLKFNCPSDHPDTDPACTAYDGAFVIQSLAIPHFRGQWRALPIGVILAFIVFYVCLTALVLKFKKPVVRSVVRVMKRWSPKVLARDVDKQEQEDEKECALAPSLDSGFEKQVDEEGSKEDRIDVRLVDYALVVHRKSSLFQRPPPSTSTSSSPLSCPPSPSEPSSPPSLRTKTLLDGISTTFHAGKLNLIIGPSGSGKSSLLNLMAARLRSSIFDTYVQSGDMIFQSTSKGQENTAMKNERVPTDKEVRELIGYVIQDDGNLLPYLTVRETLEFSARLRLRSSKGDWRKNADDVIRSMGLRPCADRLVSQLSGGEKRRVSIAVQILTEPRIILLDEPTSGLDAFTAQSIIEVLTKLAREGRTVISTIHQARAEVFNSHLQSSTAVVATNILVLAKGGRVVYSGPSSGMLDTFEKRGETCGMYENPGNWCLDLITGDEDNVKRLIELEKVEKGDGNVSNDVIRTKQETGHIQRGNGQVNDLGGKGESPIWVALPILFRRGTLSFKRDTTMATVRLVNVIGLGVLTVLFFTPLKHDYVSVQNRVGCIQEAVTLYFAGILQNVAVFPAERDAFYKDYADGTYSVESFFFSYTLLELPLEAIAALVYAALVAIVTNLNRSTSFFFITALNALCVVNTGESLGIIFNTLLKYNTGLALNMTNLGLSVCTFMTGLMSLHIPSFFAGLNYLSPLKYMARSMMVYAFRGLQLECPGGECPLRNGDEVLEVYGMGDVSPGIDLAILVGIAVVYRALAYLVLKVVKARFGIKRE